MAIVALLIGGSEPIRSDNTQLDEIRAFISVPAKARLESAIAAHDFRFLGVYGFTLEVPGIPSEEAVRLPGSAVLGIPGTSDALISEEHGILNERARAYAEQYNTLLLRRRAEKNP